MSGRVLSRERGTCITCNGCGKTSTTGQVRLEDHRGYLASQKWGRGINAGTKTEISTKRHDLCPACKASDRAVLEERQKAAAAVRAVRDAVRRLTPEQRVERKKEQRARAAQKRKDKRHALKAAEKAAA